MSPKYEVIVYWSKKDEAFIAEVPELPGCVADGASYGGALAAAEVGIREWIETVMVLRRTIPDVRAQAAPQRHNLELAGKE